MFDACPSPSGSATRQGTHRGCLLPLVNSEASDQNGVVAPRLSSWLDRDLAPDAVKYRLIDAYWKLLRGDDGFLREGRELLNELDGILLPDLAGVDWDDIRRGSDPSANETWVRMTESAANGEEPNTALKNRERERRLWLAKVAVLRLARRWRLPRGELNGLGSGAGALFESWNTWVSHRHVVWDPPNAGLLLAEAQHPIRPPAAAPFWWDPIYDTAGDLSRIKKHLVRELRASIDAQASELKKAARAAGWNLRAPMNRQRILTAASLFYREHRPLNPVSVNDLARERSGDPYLSADEARLASEARVIYRDVRDFMKYVDPLDTDE